MRSVRAKAILALAGSVVAGSAFAGSAGLVPSEASNVPAAATANWPAYLFGPRHSSSNPGDRTITPSNARRLVARWRFRGGPPPTLGQPRRGFLSSPTVVGGTIYIGSVTGWFYKINAANGHVLAKRFIGFQRALTCHPARGFVDTATVATDQSGQRIVYVGGPDGFLYALRASDLSIKWRSVIAIPSHKINDFFQWSSPTVANGRVYIGIASNCDRPLVRAGLVSYMQATGRRITTFRTLPRGMRGASIWSSAAVGRDRSVYVSTGNVKKSFAEPGHTDSIVKLTPFSLRPVASFKVPPTQVRHNGDFGASPVVFGPFVGACNKNGIFYALRRSTMKLAWSRRVGAEAPRRGVASCVAAAVYNGHVLYVATSRHIINGRAHPGSVQALNPATGALIWQTGLPNGVIGTPTLNGAGVLAVGTYAFTKTPNAVFLLRASDGKILRRLTMGSQDFAQSVFAGGRIFTANSNGLVEWGLRK
ncbi:MAG: outer membrane protein assembly factor BamB family protein [Streptosporangiaceae bacterium]